MKDFFIFVGVSVILFAVMVVGELLYIIMGFVSTDKGERVSWSQRWQSLKENAKAMLTDRNDVTVQASTIGWRKDDGQTLVENPTLERGPEYTRIIRQKMLKR